MLQRKKRAAKNTWFKLFSPLITTGERQGQRDYERKVEIRVIPEASFNIYGDKKTNGFTLSELKHLIKTGGPLENHNQDDMDSDVSSVSARVVMGTGDGEFSKDELQQIVTTMEKEGGPWSPQSPMDAQDVERMKREGRWNDDSTVAPANGPSVVGPLSREAEPATAVSK